jgi:(1->4)-alpha-D-glucan 1-alpha-D-glucosylmutase
MNGAVESPVLSESMPDTEALRQLLRERLRIPVSTYRLQLHRGFTFRDAAALVPYLAQLGVTDCYCSPYLQARPGSLHGYDITDHTRLNPELGSEADYQALVDGLARHHMGQVLDFVPNHMGVHPVHNHWWRDVLENGHASPYARFFDIDWDPVKPELKNKVLLPVLGGSYGQVLDRGELQLAYQDGALEINYFDLRWPVDPATWPRVLRHNLEDFKAQLKEDDPSLQEYLSILTQLDHLPPTTDTARERVAERQREKEVARDRLERLLKQAPAVRRHLDAVLQMFNGRPKEPASFDLLHELLEAQPYRLAYWMTALHEINYRRFFDINDLAGLRMEDPAVFAATHELVLRLIGQGKITGLRLDHLDGLFDPAGYVESLQKAVVQEIAAMALRPGEEVSDAWRRAVDEWRDEERQRDPGGPADKPLYLLAEKILSANESLPESWPLHGTSGYDFLNDLNRLFIDALQMKRLKQVYGRFTGQQTAFADVVYECKKLITRTSMASELNVLGHALNRISEIDRHLRDFTLMSLRQALREVVVCFPVYRTYVNAHGAAQMDRQVIEVALRRARRRNPAMEPTVFDFVREVLLAQRREGVSDEAYCQRLSFAMKFQQYTGPVQAKGLEDTAFYRYNVLLSLNEVGGDPQRFGAPVAHFHEANRRRREQWPAALLATATHDTKRGEDARARLNLLSEVPDDWRRHLARWSRLNAGLRTLIDGEPAPDRNDEYLFYQALLGAWPAAAGKEVPLVAPADLVSRLSEYMKKAIKEAKVHTSWINPNEEYDKGVADFLTRTLAGPKARRFLAEFLPFQRFIALRGMVNSLAQVVLKIISPGVPDFYQGTELWDFSLVDPDNRRPVNFSVRDRLLKELEPLLEGSQPDQAAVVAALVERWEDGTIKLFVTAGGLRLRRRLRRLVLEGDYQPLEAQGDLAEHVVGVARRQEDDCILALVPRLIGQLLPLGVGLPLNREIWQDTAVQLPADLASGRYRNIFTGELLQPTAQDSQNRFFVGDVLRSCPVALFVKDRGQ